MTTWNCWSLFSKRFAAARKSRRCSTCLEELCIHRMLAGRLPSVWNWFASHLDLLERFTAYPQILLQAAIKSNSKQLLSFVRPDVNKNLRNLNCFFSIQNLEFIFENKLILAEERIDLFDRVFRQRSEWYPAFTLMTWWIAGESSLAGEVVSVALQSRAHIPIRELLYLFR